MNAPLKVLVMTHWYPTAKEPVTGIFVRESAKAAALYADVQVLHCAGPDPSPQGLRLWRLEEEPVPELTEGIPTFRVLHRPLGRRASYAAYVWGALGAYRALVRRGFRPGVIHAYVHQAGVPAVLVGRVTGTPVVISENTSGHAIGLHDRLNHAKARFALERARRVLVGSAAQQQAIEEAGIRARFEVIQDAVDLELFAVPVEQRSDGPARLLFVGRMGVTHRKGVPVLLEALARTRTRRSDWHLDLVGDGPSRPEYERRAEELGLLDQVTFYGLQPKAAVAALMWRATLLVLPSWPWDTSPNVVAEAQVAGLPVVATSVGGIPEMVSEEAGILVAPRDPKALAEAIEHALDGADAFDRRGISAAARERWGLPAVGSRLVAIYEGALAGR